MSNQHYNMYIDVGNPNKNLPKKKIYSSEKFIIMLIPDQFKDMVLGYYRVHKKTPKYLSWYKHLPQYEDWVNWFCASVGKDKPIHLYHGEQPAIKEDKGLFG
jgi:hypothetical protein